MDYKELNLLLTFLCGRIPKANIELHDIRSMIGSKIEYTFYDLRKGSFGYLRIDNK